MGQAKRLKELEKENSRLKRVERGTSPVYALGWLRGSDLNRRPLGHEPTINLILILARPFPSFT